MITFLKSYINPRNIRDFFSKGSSRLKGKKMSLKDIDAAIAEAVIKENVKEE